MQKKMNEIVFSSDSTISIQEIYKIDTEALVLFRVNPLDTTFIVTGMFEDYWLAEINKDGEIISTIDYPIREETKNIPQIVQPTLYSSSVRFTNSPDNKRIVVATANQGLISFLSRSGSGIKEYKQLKYHAPIFTVIEGASATYSRENIEGFFAVDCDDNYIYSLYSGRTYNKHQTSALFCEHLLVYDWEGNPVKRYIMDIPLRTFCYNKEMNCIYGLTENPEGVLVEYKL